MDNDKLTQLIDSRIQLQLGNFNSPPVATHTHNGWDANQLDPVTSLTGFPVYQVVDASVAPTDQSDNGKFRFQVDNKGGTPHYYLWVYLVYADQSITGVYTGTGRQIAKWVKVALT